MNINFIIFFTIFITAYSLLNYYVGIRLLHVLLNVFPALSKILYWSIFWLVAEAYVIGRMTSSFFNVSILSNSFIFVGAYWLGAFYYFILSFFLVDIIGVLGKWTGAVTNYAQYRNVSGLIVIGIVFVTFVYGVWNARQPQVTKYDIKIAKHTGSLKKLHVVAVSDIHLGNLVNKNRLEKLIAEIKKIHPDIVLMAGDVIDEDIHPFIEQNMKETFLKIKPRYGMYAALGNHEYIGGHVEAAIDYLKDAGITVLRDDYIKINNSFYIVGRDDRSRNRFMKTPRKDLDTVLKGIDKELPIIVLDHQPYDLDIVQKEGVDVQISGHTHNGQLFPNSLITSRLFEIDWGYLKKDNLNVIVSSGFGTWGPPLKVGNPAEIIDLYLHFE